MKELLIFGYIVLYVITYYYCRWLVIKRLGKDSWDWEAVILYGITSLFTILTIILQTLIYGMPSIKLKLPSIKLKLPKWL